MAEFQKPPPLDIKCTSTDCDNDLHCFKQLKKMRPDQRGKCRACGADLVDWRRPHCHNKGDAAQTPFGGNAIYYAQHATATCCRTCLDDWHDIPRGRSLTAEEFDYCTTPVNLFLDRKLPELIDEPIKVPRRRSGMQLEPGGPRA